MWSRWKLILKKFRSFALDTIEVLKNKNRVFFSRIREQRQRVSKDYLELFETIWNRSIASVSSNNLTPNHLRGLNFSSMSNFSYKKWREGRKCEIDFSEKKVVIVKISTEVKGDEGN